MPPSYINIANDSFMRILTERRDNILHMESIFVRSSIKFKDRAKIPIENSRKAPKSVYTNHQKLSKKDIKVIKTR